MTTHPLPPCLNAFCKFRYLRFAEQGVQPCRVANRQYHRSDEEVRRRIDRAININEVCDVNPFGVIATMAAYNEGGEWLDALRKYLRGNYEYLCRFFKERLPQYPVLPLEGTYLVWIDCSALVSTQMLSPCVCKNNST